jgi:hypothetical protein
MSMKVGVRLQIGTAEIKSESVAGFIPEPAAGLLRIQHRTYAMEAPCATTIWGK